MVMGGQRHASTAFTPGKDPVPVVEEAGWAPGPVWIGAENLAPPGFDPRTVQPTRNIVRDKNVILTHKIISTIRV